MMKQKRIYLIAEAGVNHNGSLRQALKLIDVAKWAGANAVKFQTFKTSEVLSHHAIKAAYQKRTTLAHECAWDMIKRLELNEKDHRTLAAYSQKCGIEFLSTPFDHLSLHFLVSQLHVKKIKIPSGEITNAPLLLEIGRTGLPVILSTGMANLNEIRDALGVLAFGYLHCQRPNRSSFEKAFHRRAGQQLLHQKVTLLQCTTEYPAPLQDVNLRAMATLRDQFHLSVGFSDHTQGLTASIAAAALDADIIEKHFTLDRHMPGPDHKASLEPPELKQWVQNIRDVEKILGSYEKKPAPSETPNKIVARKSLVTTCYISQGEKFTPQNLAAKRPGTGRSPFEFWDFLGQKSSRNLKADQIIP